jgi:oligogalacturonide lyase
MFFLRAPGGALEIMPQRRFVKILLMSLFSRREFLAAIPAVQIKRASGRGQQYPSEIKRYADPLTEREVWRLTSPANLYFHPYSYQRFVARNNSFVLLAGRREEGIQIFRLELPSGRLAQLTQGAGIEGYSICLAPDERSVFFLQSGVLKQLSLRTLKEREIYHTEGGWWATGDMGISADGRHAAVIEMQSADRVAERKADERLRLQFERRPLCRIRAVEIAKENSWIVTEEKAWIGRPQFRPRRDQLLYCRIGPWEQLTSRLWLVNLDGKQKQNVRRRQGEEELGPEYWTADGRLIGYAHYQSQNGRKATVRTINPDTREERVLTPCTQFWHLRGNSNNSAIAGECRSKAGPNIYVVFPELQREMTICEHASSGKAYVLAEDEDPLAAQPRPAFSPDSQWIYFASDRHGAPAVYRAGVADMVEKT